MLAFPLTLLLHTSVLYPRAIPDLNQPPWNIVLISIDTLRADRLGCYGYRNAETPHLDKLASEGILFEQAFTPVPLTLPAHVSLLTGAYPAAHGVHDNGEALPGSFPTLAEHLHSLGFRTGAFIGSFILDRRFGLAKGFDLYNGEFHLNRASGSDPGTIQIRGDQVEASAEDWIAKQASGRFFVFIHFFDLHGPYLLPPVWRSRFPNRIYDGEVSFVDDLIGRFWSKVKEEGLEKRTLLVITADHGEGLGDHGERNHGFFLYNATTRVPLIVRFPDSRSAGRRITTLVRLIDVAPTLCSLVGVRPLSIFEGRSLSALISGGSLPSVSAYSESVYPYRHFHCAPLYALRKQQYTYIEAPRPELYDRLADPTETRNLTQTNRVLTDSMREELASLKPSFRRISTSAPVRPEVMEELKSLGYVGTSTTTSGMPRPDTTLVDPKDRIALYRGFQDALQLESQGKYREAAERLDRLLAIDPALVSVQIEAGITRQYLHQDSLAVRNFEAALRVDPQNALAHYDLGVSFGNLNRDTQAVRELDVATKLEPWFSRAFIAKGLALARQDKLPEAIASLDSAINIDASDFDAFLNRGNLYGMLGNWARAQSDLDRAAALEPNSAKAHEALGTLAFHQGNLKEALERFRRAASLDPRSSSIHSDLGLLYIKLRKFPEARSEFMRALALDPANSEARRGLKDLRQSSRD